MNEALQTQLADIAELAKNGVLQAVEVLRVQMPELCSQVLTYGFWRSVLSVIISLIGIIIFYKVLKYAIITGNKGNWETGTRYEMCIPLMVISKLG